MSGSSARTFAILGAVVAFAAPARADTVRECVDRSESAQVLRDEGKFSAARASFVFCSREGCPLAVRKECATWLTQLDERMPTVVFGARDADDHDLPGLTVSGDGVELGGPGRAFPIDPGPHSFVFSIDGKVVEKQSVVIRDGEKGRYVGIVVRPQAKKIVALPPPPPLQRPASDAVPLASWVLGGVGIVGLAGFGYFRIKAGDRFDELERSCAPACRPEDASDVRTQERIAFASLGVGIASLAAAALFYVFRPRAQLGSSAALVPR